MTKKHIGAVVLFIALMAAGLFLLHFTRKQEVAATIPGDTQNSQQSSAVSRAAPSAALQTPESATGVATIVYTDNGFSPSTLRVKIGATVAFKNQSPDSFWPASNPHPAHSGYPTRGGCRSSTFDACTRIPPGGSWSFTFGVVGTWGYHDHLSAGYGGTVIVEQ